MQKSTSMGSGAIRNILISQKLCDTKVACLFFTFVILELALVTILILSNPFVADICW